MGIIAWIVLGLIAGLIAKAIMPGKDPGGFIVTTLIGIVGALIGGWISTLLGGTGLAGGLGIKSIALAIIGAIILLALYRMVKRKTA